MISYPFNSYSCRRSISTIRKLQKTIVPDRSDNLTKISPLFTATKGFDSDLCPVRIRDGGPLYRRGASGSALPELLRLWAALRSEITAAKRRLMTTGGFVWNWGSHRKFPFSWGSHRIIHFDGVCHNNPSSYGRGNPFILIFIIVIITDTIIEYYWYYYYIYCYDYYCHC